MAGLVNSFIDTFSQGMANAPDPNVQMADKMALDEAKRVRDEGRTNDIFAAIRSRGDFIKINTQNPTDRLAQVDFQGLYSADKKMAMDLMNDLPAFRVATDENGKRMEIEATGIKQVGEDEYAIVITRPDGKEAPLTEGRSARGDDVVATFSMDEINGMASSRMESAIRKGGLENPGEFLKNIGTVSEEQMKNIENRETALNGAGGLMGQDPEAGSAAYVLLNSSNDPEMLAQAAKTFGPGDQPPSVVQEEALPEVGAQQSLLGQTGQAPAPAPVPAPAPASAPASAPTPAIAAPVAEAAASLSPQGTNRELIAEARAKAAADPLGTAQNELDMLRQSMVDKSHPKRIWLQKKARIEELEQTIQGLDPNWVPKEYTPTPKVQPPLPEGGDPAKDLRRNIAKAKQAMSTASMDGKEWLAEKNRIAGMEAELEGMVGKKDPKPDRAAVTEDRRKRDLDAINQKIAEQEAIIADLSSERRSVNSARAKRASLLSQKQTIERQLETKEERTVAEAVAGPFRGIWREAVERGGKVAGTIGDLASGEYHASMAELMALSGGVTLGPKQMTTVARAEAAGVDVETFMNTPDTEVQALTTPPNPPVGSDTIRADLKNGVQPTQERIDQTRSFMAQNGVKTAADLTRMPPADVLNAMYVLAAATPGDDKLANLARIENYVYRGDPERTETVEHTRAVAQKMADIQGINAETADRNSDIAGFNAQTRRAKLRFDIQKAGTTLNERQLVRYTTARNAAGEVLETITRDILNEAGTRAGEGTIETRLGINKIIRGLQSGTPAERLAYQDVALDATMLQLYGLARDKGGSFWAIGENLAELFRPRGRYLTGGNLLDSASIEYDGVNKSGNPIATKLRFKTGLGENARDSWISIDRLREYVDGDLVKSAIEAVERANPRESK